MKTETRLKIFFLMMVCLFAGQKTVSGAVLEIDPESAAPVELNFPDMKPPLHKNGGFAVHDFNAKQDLTLKGKIIQDGDRRIFDATGKDITIHAVFSPQADGSIEVSGKIESLKPEDRAVILRYAIPVQSKGAVFGSEPGQNLVIDTNSKEIGTYIPVSAMAGKDWGVSLSIPPDFPCCFGLTGTQDGLGVEFYFGLTPETKAFPNSASFRFVIDTAKPGWGFRSALDRYYKRYAEYYTPRYKGSGLWNWNDPASGLDERVVAQVWPLFRAHGLPLGGTSDEQAERNRKYDVMTIAYTIVGQRELVNLGKPPKDYDTAMQIFSEFETEWNREGAGGPLHKKYANSTTVSSQRNREIVSQIRNSTLFDAEGKYRMLRRTTAWGGGSVSFIENPNPDLFKEKNVPTVGSVTLELSEEWLKKDNVQGIHVDSIGSNWPGYINYRRDHFAYARYPLTFDRNGRIGLHNMISHCEYLEDLRGLALKYGKYTFANGIDVYTRKDMREHYNGVKNGRFFVLAQFDMAGREISDDLLDAYRLGAMRVFCGRKLLTGLLYKWKDPQIVKVQMNRALAFGMFAAPNRFFEDQISYLASPDGFARDKELLEWFCKNARMLHDAGWEPVTYAQVDQAEMACERYGSGDVIYFTVGNFSDEEKKCELTVDMAALGMAHEDGNTFSFSEVSRGEKIAAVADSTTGRIRMTLPPNETWIIKLARTW